MKNHDDEWEMLLGEIPRATSSSPLNHHRHSTNLADQGCGHASRASRRYACPSPVTGFSLQSDGSSSSLFSGGFSLSDLGSPSPPQIGPISGNGFRLDSKKDNDFSLSRNLTNMYISEEQEYGPQFFQSYFDPISPWVEMQCDQRNPNLLGSRCLPNHHLHLSNLAPRPRFYRNNNFPMDSREAFFMPNMVQLTRLSPRVKEDNLLPFLPNGREDSSLIVQGFEGTNHGLNRGVVRSRGHNSSSNSKKSSLNQEKMLCSFSLPAKCSSLVAFQGYIYPIAKDQHGCRFLQRMFDEGTSQDVQIVFNEIIDHVVELMMNPFGNYLMQKLLEVCSEEHKMHILLRVTQESGELVRISLNTHGTRVVQKLVETLKTRQQKALVISALEPGFLPLIKDLNGNHVIQRCLQCFTTEDSKFIFIAAAKHCVEIATHQHGCCVLQRCITYATGELRENLVEEIAENGLLLAQDAYGNYVIQFILELKLPSPTSKLTHQFEGHYVNLSRQKFSSHVVEKCLGVCNDEICSKIIHEVLSTTYFEQLLQDPHGNYVVQTALRASRGRLTSLHNSLAEAVEFHKSISRNSPYSKRIFSNKLLRR